jgi:ankyrin repeat protein
MGIPNPLPYRAGLEEYARQAHELFDALRSGDDAAAWRFKWMHPRFRGKHVREVGGSTLDLADAQLVLALDYGFATWADLVEFADTVGRDGPVRRFEAAVEAVINGDLDALRSQLREDPQLVRARSTRRHQATLLHYVAANGVEDARQKTPPNALAVAKMLLDAGAEPDALADMYDHKCTTMSMLVSSCHPAKAGLQTALAETLLDYGASHVGPGTEWQSALMTALIFGYPETAEALAGRGAPVNHVAAAAGLGRLDDTLRLLPAADTQSRHLALALAAQTGRTEVVRLLLDAGEDPNRYNPEGCHSHATPLHHAVCWDNLEVVRLLVERGARLDVRDKVYDGTPLGWAIHCDKPAIAEYLRERGAPS